MHWNIECSNCGYKDRTYSFGDQDSYGRLLGTTASNEIAEFNAWDDPVFNEISSLLDEILPEGEPNHTLYFHHALGVACDPAPSGEQYVFSGEITCPNCGSKQVNYGPSEPPIVELVDIPLVTHKLWQQLSRKEKLNLIEKKLQIV
jgi:hypothetical protein